MQNPTPDPIHETALGRVLSSIFDRAWYQSRYPDVTVAGLDPLRHFIQHGAAEGRDPNRWFDSAWYARHYPDVGTSGGNPLLHYLQSGGAELRNPHPRFDAAWYVSQHPEAAANPLLYHLQVGMVRGWLTEKPINIADYLPSGKPASVCSKQYDADVIIPVYKGLETTRRCIESVLGDPARSARRVIVIDDKSPDAALSAWLKKLAQEQRIVLLRNSRNQGFVASVNRGIAAADGHDVVLLNSDTEVPAGWLDRLAARAYAEPRIASVSPLSNNATICGYPLDRPSPLPFGRSLAEVDAACQAVNGGRTVTLPTTVGFCMYIRREALADVGVFDEAAFGRGYGEENDFCLRATARGWGHRLACDVFVYHEGSVSFGAEADARITDAMAVLTARYPDYPGQVARHVRDDAIGPYRIALTAALFARGGLPVILMVSHDLGGGVQRHIDHVTACSAGRAHVLLLRATARGTSLSVPMVPGHPELELPAERLDDLARVLRSAGVSRVHVHHLAGIEIDLRALINQLGVPFDLTVHDYWGLCPQVNLLPWPDGLTCGEPGPAACNACIVNRPSHGARDILSWRGERAWLFHDADRVICPSQDTFDRLDRFGLASRAVVAPHEPIQAGPWPWRDSRLSKGKLRVALIGVLANHKGAAVAATVIEAAPPSAFEFHLIGDVEDDFPAEVRGRLHITGRYEEHELTARLAQVRPHVLWFPASWPETFSYTLSAGIASGLPVVATEIGSFPERLAGRPRTWLVPPTLDPTPWLDAFADVRATLAGHSKADKAPGRLAVADYYESAYLPLTAPTVRRRAGRPRIVVIPERLDNGALSPCAYIRLLLPLDHPGIGQRLDVVLADAQSALHTDATAFVTQRHAIADVATADALAAHARTRGARLIYDLDDDLLHLSRDHPDAARLRPLAAVVRRMLRHADQVFVSTPALAERVGAGALVVPNGLDERLWGLPPVADRRRPDGPVRILCMGTATHDQDFALIEPALARIKAEFGHRVSVEMLGFSSQATLPGWVTRIAMPVMATASYPGFIHWFTRQPGWDIGLAPLVENPFNRCKSPIKALDYGAIGLPVLASDGEVYGGSLAAGAGGLLVPNTVQAWYTAISRLVRDPALRLAMSRAAGDHYTAAGTLRAQAGARRAAWMQALRPEPVAATAGRRSVRRRV